MLKLRTSFFFNHFLFSLLDSILEPGPVHPHLDIIQYLKHKHHLTNKYKSNYRYKINQQASVRTCTYTHTHIYTHILMVQGKAFKEARYESQCISGLTIHTVAAHKQVKGH